MQKLFIIKDLPASRFAFFAIIITVFLWMVQTVFLNMFYEGMKQQSIMQGTESIQTAYEKLSGEELRSEILDISSQYDIYVSITTFTGVNFYTTDPPGREYSKALENYAKTSGENYISPLYVLQLAAQIIEHPEHNLSVYFDDSQGNRMLVNGQLLASDINDAAVLVVSSTLQPMRDTIMVLSNQLIYMTLIIFAIGTMLALFISKSITKPLVRITKQAEELSDGNYDINFDYGKYNEVNQLAYTLNYATQGLKQVEGLRTELIANVSHDLRTPLTMIKAYAEMIRDLSGDNPQKRDAHLNVIIEESDRLTALVQNLLDLSKMQAGVENLHPTTFDINAKIVSVCNGFEELKQNSGYNIELMYDSSELVNVCADEQKIHQVLYNLISNAINYTGDDKIVYINLEQREQSVRVFIKDTGEGISEDNIDKIWEKYYRASEHKRSVAGSGIGLSIVKTALKLHGTEYGVNSKLGDGAEFWFDLPKAREIV